MPVLRTFLAVSKFQSFPDLQIHPLKESSTPLLRLDLSLHPYCQLAPLGNNNGNASDAESMAASTPGSPITGTDADALPAPPTIDVLQVRDGERI